MNYAESLKVDDKAYVWNSDIRYSAKIAKIEGRYIHTSRFGRFGRKTGKGVDEPHLQLANIVGEKVVN